MIIILRTLHPSPTCWSSLKRVKRIPPFLCIRIHSKLSPDTDWSDYSHQSDPNGVREGPQVQWWQHLQKLHAVVAHFSNPNSKRRHVQRNYHQQKLCISETNSSTLAILIVVRRDLGHYKLHLHPWPLLFSQYAETWITVVGVQRSANISSGVVTCMMCRRQSTFAHIQLKHHQSSRPAFLQENWSLQR